MSDSDDGEKDGNDDDIPERPSSIEGLKELSYRDLQKLAMDAGIRANQKTEELTEALADEYGLGEEEKKGDSGKKNEPEGSGKEPGGEPEERSQKEETEGDNKSTEEGQKDRGQEEKAEESAEETGDDGENESDEGDETEKKDPKDDEEKTTKDRLEELGFYDNDFTEFPPELSGIKRFKVEGNSQPIVEALDIVNTVFMKHEMVEALGRIGDGPAVEKLTEQVDDNDTREQAIDALGIAGSDRATDRLVELLDPEKRVKPHVRAKSAEAVGRIGDADAVGHLVTLLTGEGLEDDDEGEAEGDDQEDENYEPPESARVRGAIAESLGNIGESEEGAVGALVELLEEDTDETVRLTAARALSKIGDDTARGALAEYADDRNELVAQKAKESTQ